MQQVLNFKVVLFRILWGASLLGAGIFFVFSLVQFFHDVLPCIQNAPGTTGCWGVFPLIILALFGSLVVTFAFVFIALAIRRRLNIMTGSGPLPQVPMPPVQR